MVEAEVLQLQLQLPQSLLALLPLSQPPALGLRPAPHQLQALALVLPHGPTLYGLKPITTFPPTDIYTSQVAYQGGATVTYG